jgi:hypothetical protein
MTARASLSQAQTEALDESQRPMYTALCKDERLYIAPIGTSTVPVVALIQPLTKDFRNLLSSTTRTLSYHFSIDKPVSGSFES